MDGEVRGVYRVLMEEDEGTSSLGISRLRWEDNIKMDLEVGFEGMGWIEMA